MTESEPTLAELYERRIVQAMAAVATQLERRYGTQSEAERATGIRQGSISKAKSAERWRGLGTPCQLALMTESRTIDGMVAEHCASGSVELPEPVHFELSRAEGWSEALEAARDLAPETPDEVWDLAGRVALPSRPSTVTVDLVMQVAQIVRRLCQQSRVRRKSAAGGQ